MGYLATTPPWRILVKTEVRAVSDIELAKEVTNIRYFDFNLGGANEGATWFSNCTGNWKEEIVDGSPLQCATNVGLRLFLL